MRCFQIKIMSIIYQEFIRIIMVFDFYFIKWMDGIIILYLQQMFNNHYEEESHFGQIGFYNKTLVNTLGTSKQYDLPLSPLSSQFKQNYSQCDNSFQNFIYQNNSEMIRQNIVEYLNSCLNEKISSDQMFNDQKLFIFEHEMGEEESFDGNIKTNLDNNKLLTQLHKKLMKNCYEGHEEFRHLYGALNGLFQKSIFQELECLISIVLEHKLQDFVSLQHSATITVIPQFLRFYGFDQNENFAEESQFENCLDYSAIKKFANLGVEDFSTNIYFSNNIKFLNLKKIAVDLNEGVNLLQKFSSFMAFISEAIFLTLAGFNLPEEQLSLFKQQINLNLKKNQEGILINSLNKKIKLDFL